MNELDWFVKVCDWEVNHFGTETIWGENFKPVWQQIVAVLKGWA